MKTKFNTNVKNSSSLTELERLLYTLLKEVEAEPTSALVDTREGMCCSAMTFTLKGNEYQFSITNDAEELALQNVDGSPNVRTVQLDSAYEGNLECCDTVEELREALNKL